MFEIEEERVDIGPPPNLQRGLSSTHNFKKLSYEEVKDEDIECIICCEKFTEGNTIV